MTTVLRSILAIAVLLTLGGPVAAKPDASPTPITKIANDQAPQRFLDAFREGDEETMQAIAEAAHIDVFETADALLRAHLGGALANPPTPRDYLQAAAELAERAEGVPQGAGLVRLVKAWIAWDREGLQRAHRVAAALHAADIATGRKANERVLRIVAHMADDMRRLEGCFSTACLLMLEGRALVRLSRHYEAATAYRRARDTSRALGWRHGVGLGLLNEGYCAAQLHDYRRARDLSEQALAVFQKLGRSVSAGKAERNLVLALTPVGEPQRARALATRLRERYVAEGAPAEAADMLLALASAAGVLGEHREAAQYCEQAVAEYTTLGDPRSAASAMTRMGLALSEQGRYAAALHAYDLAWRALGKIEATALRASIALNRGTVHARLGLVDEARRDHENALSGFLEARDAANAARARTNLAGLVYEQGEVAEAVILWEELLTYWRDLGNSTESAKVSSNLSMAYRKLNRLDDADRAATWAMEGFASSGSGDLCAHAERQLAQVALARGHLDTALRHAERSIRRFEAVGARSRLEAQTHRVLAGIHLERANPARALASLERTREIEQMFGHGLGEVTGLGLRSLVRPTSDMGVVAAHQLATAVPERADEALAAAYSFAESGRGLLLAEQLANADVLLARHLPAELLELDALTRSDVSAARKALVRLVAEAGPDPDTIHKARQALDDAWSLRRQAVGRIQREARHVADLVYPTPATIEEVRRRLGADTALLMMHLTEETTYALVITRAGGSIHDLGPAPELADLARRYLRLVEVPGSPEGKLADRLYARLIEPLLQEIEGASRLVICPDGLLAFLPWVALRTRRGDRTRRLVENWETVLIPSATVFVAAARESADVAPGRGVVALGNPTYQARSGSDAHVFAPLPASADEVRAIGSLFPPDRRKILLGDEASLSTLQSTLESADGRLRALHLACHALVDDENPRLSALALAGAEMMDLDAVYGLRTSADLVVLSACGSARGKIVRGEGPLGFVRGFLFSGARRVVASNWKVSDDSTRALMTVFYEGLVRGSLAPGAALREAQLRLLRAGKDSAHPHHWAAFAVWGPAE